MGPLNNALLDTDLIRTFVAISDVGNFSAAARRVNRTPSAISMQVKKLEDQLGRCLFNRDGRSVSLTPDGETLLGFAREMLKLNHEAVSRFQIPAIEGIVRFGAPDDFGTQFLPDILCLFAGTHPQVEVEVVLGPSRKLLKQMDEGKLDLALITSASGGINADIGEVVFTEQLVWAGRKGGKAHKLPVVPLALADTGCCWREQAVEALVESGVDYRIAYTSETALGQQAALLADLAVAPLPVSMITPEYEKLGHRNNLPELKHYNICLCQADEQGIASKAFAQHVRESFKSL